MTTLPEAILIMCDTTDTNYIPLRVSNNPDWSITFMGGGMYDEFLLSSTDITSAVTEAEGYLSGQFGLVKVVDWVVMPNESRRGVWTPAPASV